MSNPSMQVRRARSNDHQQLLELWERSVRATHHFLTEADIAELRPLVAEELAGDTVEWWVLVLAADVPVGFLGYTPNVIEGLFVDAEHIGQGGGAMLIEHAQRMSRGALAVEVNEQNQAAIRFYAAQGFSVVTRSALDSAGRRFPILHLLREV